MPAIVLLVAVGIAIAKARFDAARLGADGTYQHRQFANPPEGFALFAEWLAGFGPEPAPLCMEATGADSLPLADCLAARGLHVSVVNPAQPAAFAKSELSRAKTDQADAKLIARYALAMRPPAWTPPPAQIRHLQALLRRLENLLEMPRLAQTRQDPADPAVAGSLQAMLAALDKEIKAVREAIRQHIDGNPDRKQRAGLLESIPGGGQATAAWLLTLLSEPRGFDNAKQAVAFAGLAPRLRQSGQWAGQTRLSKTGDPMLRKALYMPMRSALSFNPAIRAFYPRLKAAGKPGKSCVCAAMRKLIHIAFAILKSGRPFDPEYKPA
jgi:transposase